MDLGRLGSGQETFDQYRRLIGWKISEAHKAELLGAFSFCFYFSFVGVRE